MNHTKEKHSIYATAWMYIKYQLLTKGIFALIVFPLFKWIIDMLIKSSGRTVISSGDYIQFILSFKGLGMLVAALMLLVLLVALDINAFILLSARLHEGEKRMGLGSMIWTALSSMKKFLRPTSIWILLYVAFVVPLVSVGLTVGPMKHFQIPNFITAVIWSNPIFSILYVALLLTLLVMTIRFIFTFHFMLLQDMGAKDAMKASSLVIRKHKRDFIKKVLIGGMLRVGAIAIVFIGLIYLIMVPATFFHFGPWLRRFWYISNLLLLVELAALVALLVIPILVTRVTRLFYAYNEGMETSERENKEAPLRNETREASKETKQKTSAKYYLGGLLLTILLINVSIGILGSFSFESFFCPSGGKMIVAHRAGGDLAAENSLLGLKKAYEAGAQWSEIDVQRTKDGQYVINHDPDFKRVTGVAKSSSEMTMEEIGTLAVKDAFDSSRPSQPVATLEDFLDFAKGKIGLFVELKGKTADAQMVDDVVAMIKERKMEKETVLLSLDYTLIEYIVETHPQLSTGYLYFFAIGDIPSMKGDYLIMEEQEATPKKVRQIQKAGKKAIVWTVNTKDSMVLFVESKVDGIITDHVPDLMATIEEANQMTDLERILGKFFGY
ncbi:MAG: glycerophosphoryl diester phosphodiesterase membrane domain-containing protein [Tissierellia bacterium]|nr:glycerophosphoryl diester phosphodiesterase membrane domain-containing protein [Tissierellia bacterium]